MTWPAAVALTGRHVHLLPLSPGHAGALSEAAETVGHLWYTSVPAHADMADEINRRLALPDMQPFTICTPDGTPVGMTTYMNTDAGAKRVEIGSTWIAKTVQRSALNTEAKLLLLTHAFEALECIAVEFRTHRLNQQSRRAIERLGAQLDGILRSHMVMPNGTLRDTAVYSIIAAEWPPVKAHLSAKIA